MWEKRTSWIRRVGDDHETFQSENARYQDTARTVSNPSARGNREGNKTHNEPRVKTAIRAYLCRRGSCRFLSDGMGNTKIRISVKMWIAELENQRAFLSRQYPCCSSCQNLDTGTQVTQALMNVHDPYAAKNPIKHQQAKRMRGVEKTRLYCRRIEALVVSRLA